MYTLTAVISFFIIAIKTNLKIQTMRVHIIQQTSFFVVNYMSEVVGIFIYNLFIFLTMRTQMLTHSKNSAVRIVYAIIDVYILMKRTYIVSVRALSKWLGVNIPKLLPLG